MRTWTSTPSSFPFLSKGTTVQFCFSFPQKVQNVLAPKEIKACKQSSDVSRTSHQLHPADPLHRHLKEYEGTRLQDAKATRNVNYQSSREIVHAHRNEKLHSSWLLGFWLYRLLFSSGEECSDQDVCQHHLLLLLCSEMRMWEPGQVCVVTVVLRTLDNSFRNRICISTKG